MSEHTRVSTARFMGLVTAAVVLGTTACGTSNVQTAGTIATESATSTQVVDLDSVADTGDLRNLTALSTHIFTGRVDAVAGTEALNKTPETQFTVTTSVSLKGTVPKQIVVNQPGGTYKGIYLSIDGDKPLVVGQWYLFATRILKAKNWYTAIPVDGTVDVSPAQALDKTSAPLARIVAAMLANPQARLVTPPAPPSSTLTFPTPTPGEDNPPPPSSPQPTS